MRPGLLRSARQRDYKRRSNSNNDQSSTADEQVFPDYEQNDPGPVYDKIDDRPTRDGKPALDPDGKPILTIFSDKDRADLQRIAWEGLQEYRKVTASGSQH